MRQVLDAGIEAAGRYSGYLGCVAQAVMALMITVDVSGRFLFNKPLRGGPEMVEQLMVCVIFFMLPYVTGLERHVKVDVFVAHITRIAPRFQWITNFVLDTITLVLFALLAWQGFVGSIDALHQGECTEMTRIPHYPFHLILAIGFSLAFLSFLMNFAHRLMAKLRGM